MAENASSTPEFQARERIAMGHARVDRCSFEEAVSEITLRALARRTTYVVTPNAQHLVLLNGNARFREIYDQADLVVAEGVSLVVAARMLGQRFPERVVGVNLFEARCRNAGWAGLRVFLLGGIPGSADAAAAVLRARCPDLQVETYCPPPGFQNGKLELARVRKAIDAARPDLLFVGFGAPKQEYWMCDHGRTLPAPVCMGVGGAFGMVAGVVPRAPNWIRRLGCEWLYRLHREPRRMWRRYLIGNPKFVWIVVRQALSRPPNGDSLPRPSARTASAGSLT